MTTRKYSINYKQKKIETDEFDPSLLSLEVKETAQKRKIAIIKYNKKPLYVQTPILTVSFGSYADKDMDKNEPMKDDTQHDITVQLGTEDQRKESHELDSFYSFLQKLEKLGADFVKDHNDEFQTSKNAKKKDNFTVKLGKIIKSDPDQKDLKGNLYPPTIKFKIQKKDGEFQDRGFQNKVLGKDNKAKEVKDQTEKEEIIRSIRGKQLKCMIRPNYFNYLNEHVYLTINIEQLLVRSNEEVQSHLSDNDDNEDTESSEEGEETDQKLDDESDSQTNKQDFKDKVDIEEKSVDQNQFEYVQTNKQDFKDKVDIEEKSVDQSEYVQQTVTPQKKGKKGLTKQSK